MGIHFLYYIFFSKFYIIYANPRVETPIGNITGYYKVSHRSMKYAAFEGIPYALPPTGQLRFEVI